SSCSTTGGRRPSSSSSFLLGSVQPALILCYWYTSPLVQRGQRLCRQSYQRVGGCAKLGVVARMIEVDGGEGIASAASNPDTSGDLNHTRSRRVGVGSLILKMVF